MRACALLRCHRRPPPPAGASCAAAWRASARSVGGMSGWAMALTVAARSMLQKAMGDQALRAARQHPKAVLAAGDARAWSSMCARFFWLRRSAHIARFAHSSIWPPGRGGHLEQFRLQAGQRRRHVGRLAEESDVVYEGVKGEVLAGRDVAEGVVEGCPCKGRACPPPSRCVTRSRRRPSMFDATHVRNRTAAASVGISHRRRSWRRSRRTPSRRTRAGMLT